MKLPIVLAAHSFGGLVARLYAHLHPGDVAGLVLVDAAHEDQDRNAPAALQQMLAMSHRRRAASDAVVRAARSSPDVTATYQALIAANRSLEGFDAETMALKDSRTELGDAGITTLGRCP